MLKGHKFSFKGLIFASLMILGFKHEMFNLQTKTNTEKRCKSLKKLCTYLCANIDIKNNFKIKYVVSKMLCLLTCRNIRPQGLPKICFFFILMHSLSSSKLLCSYLGKISI